MSLELTNDPCMLAHSVNGNGYGQLRINGRTLAAHRLAYELAHGAIPAGLHVLHRCDTPACFNARHLFLGTHVENMADRSSKRRQALGARPGNAKLDDDKVREIRRRRQEGEALSTIAADMRVSGATVSLIAKRKSWGHVQ